MLFFVAGGNVNYNHIGGNSYFKKCVLFIQQIFSVNTYLGTIDFFNWEIFLCKFMFSDYRTRICFVDKAQRK